MAPGYTWYAGRYPTWISFDSINGLVVTGGGTIDARGSLWWGNVNTRPSVSPFARFSHINMNFGQIGYQLLLMFLPWFLRQCTSTTVMVLGYLISDI